MAGAGQIMIQTRGLSGIDSTTTLQGVRCRLADESKQSMQYRLCCEGSWQPAEYTPGLKQQLYPSAASKRCSLRTPRPFPHLPTGVMSTQATSASIIAPPTSSSLPSSVTFSSQSLLPPDATSTWHGLAAASVMLLLVALAAAVCGDH